MESVLFLIRSGPRSPQASMAYTAIQHLSGAGHPPRRLTVFLLQDGVLAALDSPGANAIRALADRATFHVLAEDLALRGLGEHDLAPGVKLTDYAELVAALMEDHNRVLGAF